MELELTPAFDVAILVFSHVTSSAFWWDVAEPAASYCIIPLLVMFSGVYVICMPVPVLKETQCV